MLLPNLILSLRFDSSVDSSPLSPEPIISVLVVCVLGVASGSATIVWFPMMPTKVGVAVDCGTKSKSSGAISEGLAVEARGGLRLPLEA